MEDRLHRKAAIGELARIESTRNGLSSLIVTRKLAAAVKPSLLRRRVEHAQERRLPAAPLLHRAPEQPRDPGQRVLRERLQIVGRGAGVEAQRELRKALRIDFKRSSDHDVSFE